MATPSKTSSTAPPPNLPAALNATTRWSLLGDCSHSSAVAVGQRCRLAFHKHGLQAFGGYLEGFLPAAFDTQAVASDDKILAFLQLSDAPITLKAGKAAFHLTRGDATVKFEATPDIPLPDPPSPPDNSSVVHLPPVETIAALLDCVPKTGWGALNVEMVGIVLDANGATSTDNTSLAWVDYDGEIAGRGTRLILPRPFCLALIHWQKVLGEQFTVRTTDNAIYADWLSGEVLQGALPMDNGQVVDFSGLQTACQQTTYAPAPSNLAELLDEASIFSDDLLLESNGKLLHLSTAGPISWHRDVPWVGDVTPALTVPLKRLRTALDYAQHLAVVKDGRIHLHNPDKALYAVISTK